MKRKLYWDFVRDEAHKIDSDGCTNVVDIHKDCCDEHDLGYWYGRKVRSAYAAYVNGFSNYWEVASPATRAEIDSIFRRCNEKKSVFGKLSPIAWCRWLGCRLGGGRYWNQHRWLRP